VKTCPRGKSTYPSHFTVCPQDAAPLEDVTELAPGTVLFGAPPARTGIQPLSRSDYIEPASPR